MTYLQAINQVLIRLRESQVSTYNESDYSTMIGSFINEAKRQVEDSFNWDALSSVKTVTTAASTTTYTVTGSGLRFKDVSINCTTSSALNRLQNVPIQWIQDQQDLVSTPTTGIPMYFAWNGNDGTDSKIEIYPTPDGVYSLSVYMYIPQADLAADATVINVPSEPVVLGAYARAVLERGEDQGINSSEAYLLYRNCLSDYIAIEASRFVENSQWVAC